jgi:hypothetical protein
MIILKILLIVFTVLVVVLGAATVIFALLKTAGPQTIAERRAEDADQAQYLHEWARKHHEQ